MLKDLGEGADLEMKTSAEVWASALEKELFTSFNCKILYTDLIAHDDAFHDTELFKIYDTTHFGPFQAGFLG